MKKGSYTLLLRVSKPLEIKVGSLGDIGFDEGLYAYNGSAFGPGGLKRVERHREKSLGNGKTHWHIDYLLTRKEAEIVEVFTTGKDVECKLSREMAEKFEPVEGFGCSDCGCFAHLFRGDLKAFLRGFYENS